MKTLKLLRNSIGISQDDLANLLDISRSMLVKIERGACSMSTAALIKLAQLQHIFEVNNLDEVKVGDQARSATMNPELKDSFTRQLKTCEYYIILSERKLKKLEADFTRKSKLLLALTVLEKEDSTKNPSADYQKHKLAVQLRSCGASACEPLRKRIYLLKAEMAYLSEYLQKVDPFINTPVLAESIISGVDRSASELPIIAGCGELPAIACMVTGEVDIRKVGPKKHYGPPLSESLAVVAGPALPIPGIHERAISLADVQLGSIKKDMKTRFIKRLDKKSMLEGWKNNAAYLYRYKGDMRTGGLKRSRFFQLVVEKHKQANKKHPVQVPGNEKKFIQGDIARKIPAVSNL